MTVQTNQNTDNFNVLNANRFNAMNPQGVVKAATNVDLEARNKFRLGKDFMECVISLVDEYESMGVSLGVMGSVLHEEGDEINQRYVPEAEAFECLDDEFRNCVIGLIDEYEDQGVTLDTLSAILHNEGDEVEQRMGES